MKLAKYTVETNPVPYFMFKKATRFQKLCEVFVLSFFILVFAGLTASIYSKLKEINLNAAELHRVGQVEKARQEKKRSFHQINYHNKQGAYHLTKLNINAAKDHFERVLKIDSQNQEALLGISKTLSAHCKLENRFCEEAKEYRKYINQHDFTKL